MHFNLEGDTFVDQIAGRREHFVRWHSTDVREYLAQHPAPPPEQQATFRERAALIRSLLQHLYRHRHEQLSYIYAPLDPDRDRLLRSVRSPARSLAHVQERTAARCRHDAPRNGSAMVVARSLADRPTERT